MANSRDFREHYRVEKEKRELRGLPRLPARKKSPMIKAKGLGRLNGTAGGKEYLVQDREAFAEPIDTAISRRYAGNRDTAAKAVGIPHNTLRRHHLKLGNAVRHQTLQRLRKLVGAANAPALDAALLSPAAREALQVYDEWLSSEMRGIVLSRQRSSRPDATGGETSSKSEALARFDAILGKSESSLERVRVDLVQKLLSSLQRRFPTAWKPLTKRLVNRGHFQRRALLSQLRVIAPMLDYLETGSTEREPREWSAGDLHRFIKAGAIREAILLDRENDIRRAQEKWPTFSTKRSAEPPRIKRQRARKP